ncbi:hypothetical protein OGM63_15060 [Plectonema radiosum NIES-515]|uniref:Uncharacterized protein n=1 Tax=Plectonema radiosum NIES-515 TaxID=2986073 RepID=A0ABT3B0C0_9CYAN|nr:hypothetical protein [Plectonema radiosum]MCV3214819.1 hypothetical protein [Plectonema radiosum NIES-515]
MPSANQHFLKTSERCLEQAYQAVLKTQVIEGNNIFTESKNHTTSVISYLQADLDKKFNIAKVRIGEFKMSTNE